MIAGDLQDLRARCCGAGRETPPTSQKGVFDHMTEEPQRETPVAVIPAPTPVREGSAMRRFLAERGVILMKEQRHAAAIPTSYGAPVKVASQILVIVKGTEREISAGVKFEQSETNSQIGSAAFVDSDEIDELLGAFEFLISSATQMGHDRRDYTEITYTTRDDVTIGFFQDDLRQQAFVRLGVGSPLMFFRVDALQSIQAAVVTAREHVETRRTAWETK